MTPSSTMIALGALPVTSPSGGRADAIVRSADTCEIVFQRTNLAPARLKKGEESLSGSG